MQMKAAISIFKREPHLAFLNPECLKQLVQGVLSLHSNFLDFLQVQQKLKQVKHLNVKTRGLKTNYFTFDRKQSWHQHQGSKHADCRAVQH